MGDNIMSFDDLGFQSLYQLGFFKMIWKKYLLKC